MPITDDRTTNRSYQKPVGSNDLQDDVSRLRASFDAFDTDMAGVLAALAAKAAVNHGHVIGDVSGLQAALDSKANAGGGNFAPIDSPTFTTVAYGPTPPPNDNTTKLATTAYVVQALTAKAPVSHGHAISDVSGLQTALDGKSATGHSHAISNVTGLQTALDSKASTSHGHSIGDITSLQATLDGKLSGTLTANATAVLTNTTDIPTVRHLWDAAAQASNINVSGTYNLDFSAFINRRLTATGNIVFTRSNLKPGQSGTVELRQDATGGRTWGFTSGQFAYIGSVPVFNTTANATTLLSYLGLEDGRCFIFVLGVVTRP